MTGMCVVQKCKRESYCQNMCEAHYRRLLRRLAKESAMVKPVRKPTPGKLVTLGVRVMASTAVELEKAFETATTGARSVLDAWAVKRLR